MAIILNKEEDHLDYFKNIESYCRTLFVIAKIFNLRVIWIINDDQMLKRS